MTPAAKRRRIARFPVAIVDDHHDALLHIHRLIRRKRLAFERATMVHIDAHPDLMVPPTMEARDVFEPRRLYAALEESSGGIAEWILPLVFAGHISRVVWIRPGWLHELGRVEIEDGEHCFDVGEVALSGVLRVTPAAGLGPYFVDEQLCAPASAMVEATRQPLRLLVHALPHTAPLCSLGAPAAAAPAAAAPDVILDICLDYFCCANPFARAWSDRYGGSADALRGFFFPSAADPAAASRTHDERVARRALLQRGIRAVFGDGGAVSDGAPLWKEQSEAAFVAALAFLAPLHPSRDAAESAHRALHALLTAPLPPPPPLPRRGDEEPRSGAEERARLAAETGPMLALPHRLCEPAEVDAAVGALRAHLAPLAATRRFGGATIAASTTDGYVPRARARAILAKVLAMLHELFGAELDITYGEGADGLQQA